MKVKVMNGETPVAYLDAKQGMVTIEAGIIEKILLNGCVTSGTPFWRSNNVWKVGESEATITLEEAKKWGYEGPEDLNAFLKHGNFFYKSSIPEARKAEIIRWANSLTSEEQKMFWEFVEDVREEEKDNAEERRVDEARMASYYE